MMIAVTSSVLERLAQEAQRAFPDECCGLLFGTNALIDGLAPTRNVATEPRDRFELDPQALIDAHRAARTGGPRLVGYYHSHPRGPAAPSAIDQAEAAGDGMIWAIVGPWPGSPTLWRDARPRFVHLPYRVHDS